MAEFSIYKSEHSVRIENTMLKQKMRELEAENARLRAKAGEEAIAPSSLAADEAQAGTSFKAGNCSVQIGGGQLTTGSASVNPARTPRPPQRVQQQPQRRVQPQQYQYNGNGDQGEEQQGRQMVGAQPAAQRVDDGSDPTVMRFSMLELD